MKTKLTRLLLLPLCSGKLRQKLWAAVSIAPLAPHPGWCSPLEGQPEPGMGGPAAGAAAARRSTPSQPIQFLLTAGQLLGKARSKLPVKIFTIKQNQHPQHFLRLACFWRLSLSVVVLYCILHLFKIYGNLKT